MNKEPIVLPDGSSNELCVFGIKSDVKEVMLILPAMGVRASYYKEFAAGLVQKGRTIYSIDLRGHGNSSIRASRKMDWGYRELIEDLKSIIDILRARHPEAKLVLLGHSLGGQMACLHSAKYKDAVDGLILVATCSVYYKGWRGMNRIGMRFVVQFYRLITKIFGYFPGDKIGFGGKEGKTEMKDWCYNANKGKYKVSNDPFDYETELSNTKIRILTFTLPGDIFSPFQATQNLLKKFSSNSSIEHITLPESPKYDHFNWTKSPESFKEIIDSWMLIT